MISQIIIQKLLRLKHYAVYNIKDCQKVKGGSDLTF